MKKTAFLLAVVLGSSLLSACKKSGDAASAASAKSADKPIQSNEAVDLQPKWVVGKRYVQRMDIVQNSETAVPQMPQPMKQDTTMGQDYSISVLKERPSGGRELELEFLAVELDVSANGKSMIAFDSKGETLDDSQNPAASMFRGLIGSKLKYLLDASNRVEKIEGGQELIEKLSVKAPPQQRAMMSGLFSDDYLKQMVDHSKYLPSKPVKPGETWPSQIEMSAGPLGTLAMDLTYTFKGWEMHQQRKCAVLDFSGPLKSKDSQAPAMGMRMSIDNGNMSGKSWFDPELGMIVESAINQNMNLSMQIPGQGPGANTGAAQPQNLTTFMKQKVHLKLAEVNDTPR